MPGNTTPYELIEVPVDGGLLVCGRWGRGPRIVIASHGITANHLSWQRVGELVVERSGGEVSLAAPDHRGRALGAGLPGPYGLAVHGSDLLAIADHLGLGRVTLAGHSLGGFIVANAAEAHPQRVERLVLVDGGVPFPPAEPQAESADQPSDGPTGKAGDSSAGEALPDPAPTDIEAAVRAVIGPALDRLDMRWDTVDDYVGFFKAHPAFQPPNEWTAAVEAYVRHDAIRCGAGRIASSVRKEAVLADGAAAIIDPAVNAAVERVSTPTTWAWSPRGLLDQTPGLYPPEYVAETETRLAHVKALEAADTNHYTVLTGEAGAGLVADSVISAARAG